MRLRYQEAILKAYSVVLGHEDADVVVAVGGGVSSVKPGDHVIPLYTA